jgi:hypothetical protein
MIDYTGQLVTIIDILTDINSHLSYIAHLSFLVVLVTGTIFTLMLFYSLLRKFF